MDEPNGSNPNPPGAKKLDVRIVALAEGSLAILAVLLAYLGVRNPNHAVFGFLTFAELRDVLLWGVGSFVPMAVVLIALDRTPGSVFERMRRDTSQLVGPLFARLSIIELAVISLLAGVCEELLFRWSLQDGLAYLVGAPYGWLIAWILVSLLFGCAHFINVTYFLIAAIIGFWLGGVMLLAQSWWAAAIGHTLYDFFALCYLTNRLPGFRHTHLVHGD